MNKCNEWNCMYNKNGICNTDECLKEKEETWLDYYDSKECIFCGRLRVEKTNKGKKVCEKCHLNQDTGDYEKR